jgi:hypothetical protein
MLNPGAVHRGPSYAPMPQPQQCRMERLHGHLRAVASTAGAGADESVAALAAPSSPAGAQSPNSTITLRESNLVFSGGDAERPHMRSGHFPSVVEVEPGRLVVTFTAGWEMGAPDVRCYSTESTDGARSWTAPQKIWEPDESTRCYSTGIRMSRAHDGSLVGFVNQLDF